MTIKIAAQRKKGCVMDVRYKGYDIIYDFYLRKEFVFKNKLKI